MQSNCTQNEQENDLLLHLCREAETQGIPKANVAATFYEIFKNRREYLRIALSGDTDALGSLRQMFQEITNG